MKKYTWLFALFCVVAFLFAGCDNGSGGGPKKGDGNGGGNSNTKVLYNGGAVGDFVFDTDENRDPLPPHTFPDFPRFTTDNEGKFTVLLAFGKTNDAIIDASEYSKLVIQIRGFTNKIGGGLYYADSLSYVPGKLTGLTWIDDGFDNINLNDGKGNITFDLTKVSEEEHLKKLGGFQLHDGENAGANKTYTVTKIYFEK